MLPMHNPFTCEAIVLRAYDVGEADRFCIIFTKERGKMAARARAVRKLKSKIGGTLLPLQHIAIELRESNSGFMVTGALRIGHEIKMHNIRMFLSAMQGIEWILTTIRDGEALPEIFELTKSFLERCNNNVTNQVLPFSIRLLQLLGMFPTDTKETVFTYLTDSELKFVSACKNEQWMDLPEINQNERKRLTDITLKIAEEQTARATKTISYASYASFDS